MYKCVGSKPSLCSQEDSSSMEEFSCVLQNPVSEERSKPISNPFITRQLSLHTNTNDPLTSETLWRLTYCCWCRFTAESSAGGLKISTGLMVFISLLAALLMLVLFHRWKAGQNFWALFIALYTSIFETDEWHFYHFVYFFQECGSSKKVRKLFKG